LYTICADQNIYRLNDFVPPGSKIVQYDPDDGLPKCSRDSDALLIRTVTPINEQVLAALPASVMFIGTASSGINHVDISALDKHKIAFADARGCNARAVAEYVTTGILMWCSEQNVDINTLKIGVVGVGHVGKEVVNMLELQAAPVVAYDPPRARRDSDFKSASLDEVLACDVLTFHTPLTYTGEYATYHWLDWQKIKDNHYALVINAARGGVINEQDLMEGIRAGQIDAVIIDVWENEPDFNEELLDVAYIGTPHIAGYSKEAKTRATTIIIRKLCKHAGLPYPKVDEKEQKDLNVVNPSGSTLKEILSDIHPLTTYHNKIKNIKGLPEAEKSNRFNRLRTETNYRNEYKHVALPERCIREFPMLGKLNLQAG